MGTALIKLKIMPESPDTDLNSIKTKAVKAIEEIKGSLTNSEEQEIAFGLKALIVYVRIDENIETGLVEDSLRNIQGVSSLDIIDYRRALE